MEEIKTIIDKRDKCSFHAYLEDLKGDYNRYIVKCEESGTELNLLHVLAGISSNSSTFLRSCIRKLLENYSVDVNFTGRVDGNFGITAAHIAVQWQNISVLKLLIDYDCDLMICDSNGQNVQDYALNENNQEISKIVDDGISKWFQLHSDLYTTVLEYPRNGKDSSPFRASSILPFRRSNSKSGNIFDIESHKSMQSHTLSSSSLNSSYFEKISPKPFKNTKLADSLESWSSTDSYKIPSLNNNNSAKDDWSVVPIDIAGNDATNKIESEWNNENYWNKKSDPNHSTNQEYFDISDDNNYILNDENDLYNISSINESCVSNRFGNSNQCEKELTINPDNQYSNEKKLNHEPIVSPSSKSECIVIPNTKGSNDSLASQMFTYKDLEMEVELIEEHYLGASCFKSIMDQTEKNLLDNDNDEHGTLNNSNASIETTVDDFILKMTNSQLHNHLKENGYPKVGPVTSKTLKLYQKKANRIKKKNENNEEENWFNEINSRLANIQIEESDEPMYKKLTNYPLEFNNLIKKRFPFEEAIGYENMLINEFSNYHDEVDDDMETKSSKNIYFCYLLLDPAISDNLPMRANVCLEKMLMSVGDGFNTGFLELLDPKLFASFILSIFYVGKGQNNRAYQHFYEATKIKDFNFTKLTPKTERILDIWHSGKGPVSLHCFNGISNDEAFTREALMIEVLSLTNLTNQISGQYRCKLQLNRRQRNILGTYLLFKAFIILLFNGERQVKKPR